MPLKPMATRVTIALSTIEFIEDDIKAASHLMTESAMVVAPAIGAHSLTHSLPVRGVVNTGPASVPSE